MFKVISDKLENCYDMRNTIVNEINFCNAKNLNCAFMFIIAIIME